MNGHGGFTPQINVARLEDLPYNDSPPLQYVYQSTAALNLGSYTWADAPSAILNTRPVIPQALYYLREISLTADISALDYSANISVIPQFQMYLESDGRAPQFREAVLMNKFYESLPYRLIWNAHGLQDDFHETMLCAFTTGTLTQGPALIGKASITLTAVMSVQEIVDKNFIEAFQRAYPETEGINV